MSESVNNLFFLFASFAFTIIIIMIWNKCVCVQSAKDQFASSRDGQQSYEAYRQNEDGYTYTDTGCYDRAGRYYHYDYSSQQYILFENHPQEKPSKSSFERYHNTEVDHAEGGAGGEFSIIESFDFSPEQFHDLWEKLGEGEGFRCRVEEAASMEKFAAHLHESCFYVIASGALSKESYMMYACSRSVGRGEH